MSTAVGGASRFPARTQFVDEVAAGQPHYMEAAVRDARALIRLARGDQAGALEDSEYVVALAGEAKDPQVVHPALAIHSRILLEAGRTADAARFADELLRLLALGKTGFISYWGISLGVVLGALDRADEVEPAIAGRTETRWQNAVLAYAAGDLEGSAGLLDEMGAVVDAAYARMRAAEALAESGRAGGGRRAGRSRRSPSSAPWERSPGSTRPRHSSPLLLEPVKA